MSCVNTKTFYSNISLAKNELLNTRIENKTTVGRLALTLNNTHDGYIVWDIDVQSLYVWQDSQWYKIGPDPAEADTLDTVTTRGNITANNITVGNITATSFIKVGGTQTQFLKADGSVDSNTYITIAALAGYATENWVSTNFYTKTQINNFFSGAQVISGYNKINWDSAYNSVINSASFNTITGELVLVKQDTSTVTVDLDGRYILNGEKGQPNGVATLDGTGRVPASQLPSYVDDVVEYANLAGFPGTGETGKIYVALDTNKIYRWSGSVYIEISTNDITGSGVTNYTARWTSANTLGTGVLYDNGTNVGIGTTNPSENLHVSGNILIGNYSGSTSLLKFANVSNSGNSAYIGKPAAVTQGFEINGGSVSDFRIQIPSGSDTATLTLFGNGVRTAQFFRNQRTRFGGNVTTNPSSTVEIKGEGATSATTALRVENANASASMVVLDDGNVGIATTAPSQKLHVVGNTLVDSGILSVTNTNSGASRTATYSSNAISLQGFYNSANNNADINLGSDLVIRAYGSVNRTILQSNSGITLTNYSGTTNNYLHAGSAGVVIGGTNQTIGAKLHVKGSGTTSSTTSFRIEDSSAATLLTVLDNGFVGVGTATATSAFNKFEVVDTGATSVVGKLEFRNEDNSYTYLKVTSNNVGFSLGAHTSGAGYISANSGINITANDSTNPTTVWMGNGSRFRIGNSAATEEYFRVITNGNIGIGITSPAQKLDVAGTIRQSAVISSLLKTNASGDLVAATAGTDYQAPIVDNVTGTGVATQVAFWNSTSSLSSSGSLYWDNTNGRLGVGTTSPAYSLDVNGTFRLTGAGYSSAYSFSVQRLQFNGGNVAQNFGYVNGVSNGIIRLSDAAESDFTRLQFGGGTSSFPALQRSGSALAVVDAAGTTSANLLVGTTTDSTFFKLDVAGTARVTGVLTAENNINLYSTGTTAKTIGAYWGVSPVYGLNIYGNASSITGTGGIPNGYIVRIGSAFSVAPTDNSEADNVRISTGTFNPTSGTFRYNILNVGGTINQTGTANGITRGLYINPTLTSAPNWRSIELTNNTGFGILQSGTANNSFAGNVGIGTTAPVFGNLEVYKNGTNSIIAIHEDAGTAEARLHFRTGGNDTIFRNTSDRFIIDTESASDAITFTPNGNVGIATTSPSQKLHVVGSGLFTGTLEVDTVDNGAGDFLTRTSGGVITRRTASEVLSDIGAQAALTNPVTGTGVATRVAFWNSTSSISSDSELYWDNTNKRLGIGTSSPSEKLQVGEYTVGSNGSQAIYGKTTIFSDSGTEALLLGLGNGTYPNRGWSFRVNQVGINSSFTIKEHGLTGDRITIASGGNFGIGTTSPSEKLHVEGNIRVTGAFYDSTNSPGTSGQVLTSTATGTDWKSLSEITGVDGTGTANYVAKWSDLDTITNSIIYDNGTSVGIGTTSPSQKLNVEGNILLNVGGTVYFRDTTSYINEASGLNIVSGASRSINFSAGGFERMRITSTGNIGIGTTNPAAKLQVIGTTDVVNIVGAGTATNKTLLSVDGSFGRLFEVSDDLSDSLFSVNTIAGLPVIEAFADYTVKLGPFTNQVIINNLGNVGLGIASPTEKLHVNGRVRIATVDNGVGDFLTLSATGVVTDRTAAQVLTDIGAQPLLTNPVVGTGTSTRVAFWNNSNSISSNANLFWDNTNSRLGIGTTSPADTLTVVGTFRSTSLWTTSSGVTQWGAGSTAYGILTWDTGYARIHANTGNRLDLGGNGGLHMSISTTGDVGIGTTSPSARFHVTTSSTTGTTSMLLLSRASGYGHTLFEQTYDSTYFSNGKTLTLKNDSGIAFVHFAGNNTGTQTNVLIPTGNVGIGVTAPTEALHVVGRIRVTTVDNGTGDFLTLSATGVITDRTAAQVLTDIGGAPASGSGNYIQNQTAAIQTASFKIDGSGTAGSLQTNSFDVLTGFGTKLGSGGGVDVSIATTYTGSWARGMHFNTAGTTTPQAAFGLYGSNATAERMYMSFGSTPWSGTGLFVTSTNNVGIGDTAPSDKFVVNGRARINGTNALAFGNSTGGHAQIAVSGASTGNLTFTTYDGAAFGERMRLTLTGSLGIGTTSPVSRLTVDGNQGITINAGGTVMPNIFRDSADGGLLLRSYDSTTFTNTVKVTPAGNVGIGTTSPSQKLHVVGNVYVTGAYYDSTNGSGTSGQILSSTATGTSWINNTVQTAVNNGKITVGSLTGTTEMAPLPIATYDGAIYYYVVKNGTNLRAGTINAVWDGTVVAYTEVSTSDIGSTSGVLLSVTISGTDAVLNVTVPASGWSIKVVPIGI